VISIRQVSSKVAPIAASEDEVTALNRSLAIIRQKPRQARVPHLHQPIDIAETVHPEILQPVARSVLALASQAANASERARGERRWSKGSTSSIVSGL